MISVCLGFVNKADIFIKDMAISKSFMSQYFPLALFFIFLVVWIILTYKIGDWRHWKVYYPTILFFWCGDLIYNVVFCNKPLWIYTNPVFSHVFTDMLSLFIIFTCTVLVFIPHFPKGLPKQIIYLLAWISAYTGVEWLFIVLDGINHDNGWTIWWSAIHNTYQFILLYLHHKNPILAWILALTIFGIIVHIFDASFVLSK